MIPTITGLKPVHGKEIVKPTRVVYRGSNQFLVSLVFPTLARAVEFAAEQRDVIAIQDVHERPPKQITKVNRSFVERTFDRDGSSSGPR